MECRSPLVPSDRGNKVRTTVDKGSKVLRLLLSVFEPQASVSPARRKNLHIAASSTMAVRNKAKYDPISTRNKQQEDEKRRLNLNKEYRVHQLCDLGFPMFGALGHVSGGLEPYPYRNFPGGNQKLSRVENPTGS